MLGLGIGGSEVFRVRVSDLMFRVYRVAGFAGLGFRVSGLGFSSLPVTTISAPGLVNGMNTPSLKLKWVMGLNHSILQRSV